MEAGLDFYSAEQMPETTMKARRKPGMGRGSMAGHVEREEGGRNGRSDEENKAGCYQLSTQQVQAVYFDVLSSSKHKFPQGRAAVPPFSVPGYQTILNVCCLYAYRWKHKCVYLSRHIKSVFSHDSAHQVNDVTALWDEQKYDVTYYVLLG